MPNKYDNSSANRTGVPGIEHLGTGNRFQIPDATAENAQSLHSTIASRLSKAARESLNPKVAQDAHGNFVVRVNNPGFNNTDEARTFDITRDSNGMILGGGTENPSSRMAVTGIANLHTNTVRNNISTLVDVLNQATSGRQKSIGSVMQNMSMPSLNIDALTPGMSAKWSTAYLAVGENNNPANRQQIQGAKIPGFQVQWGGKFGDSGAAHIWDAQALNQRLLPQNELGQFGQESAKRGKNQVVPFGVLERTPGIPASVSQMSMRLPGQTQPDNVYANRVGFQMFGGDSLGEGTQLVRDNIGYLSTDTLHKMKLNQEQTNQFKSGNFGFQQGDIFRHNQGRINSIAAGTNIRAGVFDSIPGLNIPGGSSDFSMIRNMQFNEQTSELTVGVAQYTNASVASSKFQKKAAMQPVSSYATTGPLNVRDTSGNPMNFSGVQAMPSPSGAAGIGLNSLRTQYTEEQLKPMFMDYAQSHFRMGSGQQLIKSGEEGYDQAYPLTPEVTSHMWGSGALKGYTASIMSSMGAAHFNASMKIGVTEDRITQEQLNNNFSFEFGGQTHQRFSDPQDLGNGFYGVKATNVYSDLTIGERYQKTYDTGKTTFSGAILDNMAYSHPENYSTLAQRQQRQGNSALRFRQVMMANTDANAQAQLERRRKIVDVSELNAGSILAGIPQDAEDRQGEFMRQLAAGKHGGSVIRMGNNLMPSPREALARVTQDKTGRVVGNFGASYFDAISAHTAIADAALIGEDTGTAEQAFSRASQRAYSQAQELANSGAVVEESNSITQRNTAGGPAGSMPLLQANEVLMGREQFYNMLGVGDLPEEMRAGAKANIDFMRESMPDYFTMEHTMHPVTTPHQALYNLKPVLADEYEQRFGADSLPDMSGGKYFISQTLATAHGKDFDGDTSKLRALGGYFRKGKNALGSYRHNARPDSSENIKAIAARQYEEKKTLQESLEYEPRGYQEQASAYAREGLYKSTEDILTGPKGFKGQQDSQASIGPTYNTGIGKMVGFTRLMGNRSKAEAAGWIAQVGYQTATKEKEFNDPGFKRIDAMLKSGNYDWGKKEDHVAGYVGTNAAGEQEYVNFRQNVKSHEQQVRGQDGGLGSRNIGGSVRGNLATHIAEGYAMLGSSTENDEEYINKVAPNVARMMMPDYMDSNTEAHNIMTQALISSRKSGDFGSAISTYSGLVGGQSGVIQAALGQGDRASSSMSMVGAAMQARMFNKNEPAAMARQGKNDRTRAGLYEQAIAGMDVKKTGVGSTAHADLSASLSNRDVNAHHIAVEEELRGPRLERAISRLQTPEEPKPMSRQSRAEYFAGKGGLYNKPERRAPGENVPTKNQLTSRFYGDPNSEGVSFEELRNTDTQNVMERSLAGARELIPSLNDVNAFQFSTDPMVSYDDDNTPTIMMSDEKEMRQFLGQHLKNPAFVSRLAAIADVYPDDMTPEIATAAITLHETAHAAIMQGYIAEGRGDEYRELIRSDQSRFSAKEITYGEQQSEMDADILSGQMFAELKRRGVDLGLNRDSGRMEKTPFTDMIAHARSLLASRSDAPSGKGRKVRGVKKAYEPQEPKPSKQSAQQSGVEFGPQLPVEGSMEHGRITKARKAALPMDTETYYNEDGSLTERGKAVVGENTAGEAEAAAEGAEISGGSSGGYTSNTVFKIAHQTNNNATYRTKLTDNRDVEELSSFVQMGKMGKLSSYMETIGSAGIQSLSRSELRDFRETVAHYNKAANAVDTYSKEVQTVAADDTGKQRLSGAALGVEKELAGQEGRVGEAFAGINRDELREIATQAKTAWEGGLPEKYSVSGKVMSKGMAGVSNIEDLGASLGELAKSVKGVTSVTQEQYKSMKALTQSYDAAEAVVTKLTETQQRGIKLSDQQQASLDKAKDVLGANKGDLDTVRGQYAKAAMGGLSVEAIPMGNEERQQRLLEALNRGGVGGARARSRAKAQGLYKGTDEDGNESGLDYLGFNIKDEGAIDAIGGMMRLGNRAGALLQGMTHLTHNIINPIVGEIQQYGQTQVSRGQMLYGMGGQSYSQFQQGQGGRAQRIQGGANLAKQTASMGVYNTYAGLAGALGSQAMGQYQGAAQSVLAPALSAAVGMQAIGAGAYAGPLALAVGVGASVAYMNGQSSDRQGVSQALTQMYGSNRNGQVTNALSNAIVGFGSVFHSDVMRQGQEDAGLMQMFSRNNAQQMGPFQAGMNLTPSEQIDNVVKNYGSKGVTRSNAIQQQFNAYNVTATAAGLTPEQVNANFSFSSLYSPAQTGNYLRDTLDKISLSTGQDASQLIAAGTSARGKSAFDKGAMQTSASGFLQAFSESAQRGEAPSVFFARQGQQNQNAANLNASLYENYGAGGPQIDPYKYDPRAGDVNYQRTRAGIESSRAGARRSNMAAYSQDGYDIRAGIQQYERIDSPADVAVYQENEGFNLSLDRNMRARTGGGLGTQQLLDMNSMSQGQGDVFRNIVQGDAWTTSRLAKQLGNVGLATIDTKTGLGATDYGVSADQLAAFKKADKLGLLNGVSAADVAGGTMGMARGMELAQRDMQMFQFKQGQQSRAVSYGIMTGGGTLNAQGYATGGDGLKSVAAVFAQNGMKFNAGNGMGQWQIEDASTAINRQQQAFSMKQQGQSLALSVAEFGTSGQQWAENRNLQERQFNYSTQYQSREMKIGRSQQVKQEGWQREDWQYGRNMSDLQFGFQMRDADRNIRYSRGRDRLDQIRHRDDAVILHAAEMGQSDKEKTRMTEQQKWAESQFKREEEHFKQTTKFQKEQMDLDKKYHDLDRGYQTQRIQMNQQAHVMSMNAMMQEWKLEDQRRIIDRQVQILQVNMANEAAVKQQQLQVSMNRTNDIMQGISTSQHNIMAQWQADLQTIAGIQRAAGAAGSSGVTQNKPGGRYSPSQNWDGGYIPGFDGGGFTGIGDKRAVRGVVHGGEYVIPQEGTPVVRGDNQESLAVLKSIASILERIEKNPAIVNAVINTNSNKVSMRNLSLTDLAHGSIQ